MEEKSVGMRLIHKGKRGIIYTIFSRIGIMIMLMLLQIFVMFGIVSRFNEVWPYAASVMAVFVAIMVIYLLNSRMDSAAKLTWLLIIMAVPVFGAPLFWYTQTEWGHRMEKARLEKIIQETRTAIVQDKKTLLKVKEESPETMALGHYLGISGCYPIYENTKVTYFPSGEAKFEELLKQLKQAKDFIFLEYFIVEEGIMWGSVLEILAQKAA